MRNSIILDGPAFERLLLEGCEVTVNVVKGKKHICLPGARIHRGRLVPIIRGGAEIFPDEGLDIVLGQWPKNDTRLSTTYLCLFSSQSASTVITSGQTFSNVTESAWTNYARQSLAAATWGAQAAGTGGRKTTYPQITFPTVGASGGTVNGFFLDDAATTGHVIGQANFDDAAATPLNQGDIIKVTPTCQFNS